MAWSSFLFTVSSKFRQRTKRYTKTRLVNMRNLRILVRNEEVTSRYVRSFYIEPGEIPVEHFKLNTVFYFWEQDSLVKEFLLPGNSKKKDVNLILKSDGTLTVA